MKICGVDEAGRGPLIGPLVIAGVLIDEEKTPLLKKLGIKDSKLLTVQQREELFDVVIKHASSYLIIAVEPEEVDRAVNNHEGLNLNKLEAVKTAIILNELKPEKAFIDGPSNNLAAYTDFLRGHLNDKKMILVIEHKADVNYPIVGAASILAKVTRDRRIEELKNEIGIDFGSGYLSDPKTIAFLQSYRKSYPHIFRKSWAPYREAIGKEMQRNLSDFSHYVEEHRSEVQALMQMLKALEEWGYHFSPVGSSHELMRMKGACSVTLYKNGTLLVQGPENEKERVEAFLNGNR